MKYFRNAVELFLCFAAVGVICLFFAYVFPESSYGFAAWVQAIGSIGAIIAAGAIASAQAARQFRDAGKLQASVALSVDLRMTESVEAIAMNCSKRMLLCIKDIGWDRDYITQIVDGPRHYDDKAMAQILSYLDAIPLHSLPSSTVIVNVIHMRAVARQVGEKIDLVFGSYRNLNGSHFQDFFDYLDNAHMQLCLTTLAIEGEAVRIKALI